MIEVTDEELSLAGVREWERCKGVGLAESLLRCHRAMRALEPAPPELRNRQAPPPLKAGDSGMRPEDQARGTPRDHTQGGGGDITGRLGPDQYVAANIASVVRFEQASANRRLDALTALVILMASGYQSQSSHENEELNRLIAELGKAR